MIEYRLRLPVQNRLFDDTKLTFSITNIRSRRPSILYFNLYCYNKEGKSLTISDDIVVTEDDPRIYPVGSEITLSTINTTMPNQYKISKTSSTFTIIIGNASGNKIVINQNAYAISSGGSTVKTVASSPNDVYIGSDGKFYYGEHIEDLSEYDIDLNNLYLGTNVKAYNLQVSDIGVSAYTSDRGVIGTAYSTDDTPDYVHSFTLNQKLIDATYYTRIELRALGIDSENPLYFNKLMLQEGDEYNGYHEPLEMDKMNNHIIELPSNLYANLYDNEGNYLQVIRPNKEAFNTNKLDKAQYTILAPHFDEEDEVDNHISVFLEAMNQTEQKIDVLR